MLDLQVICPDRNWNAVLEEVLRKHARLGIREIRFQIRAGSVGTDGGTRARSVAFAQTLVGQTDHLLVIFDWAGCGIDDPGYVGEEVTEELQKLWGYRSRAIVVYPELEAWLIGAHKHFREVRQLHGLDVRTFWAKNGQWPTDVDKPDDPKAAIEDLFYRYRGLKRSSANYRKIAAKASLRPDRCLCPSFQIFVETLRGWFPR